MAQLEQLSEQVINDMLMHLWYNILQYTLIGDPMKTSIFSLIIAFSTIALFSQDWVKSEIDYSYSDIQQYDYYLISNETQKNIMILHLINESDKDNRLYNFSVLFETGKPILDENITVMFRFDDGDTFSDEWMCNQSRNNTFVLYDKWFIYMLQKSSKLKLSLNTSNGKIENTFNLSRFNKMIQTNNIKNNFPETELSKSLLIAKDLEKAFILRDIPTKIITRYHDSFDIIIIDSLDPIDKGEKMELITSIVKEFDNNNVHTYNCIYYMHNDYNFEKTLYYVVGKKKNL